MLSFLPLDMGMLEEDFNIAHWLDDPLTSRTYTLDRRLSSKILYTHRF